MTVAETSPEVRHVLQFVPDAEGRALDLRVRLLKACHMAAAMRGRSESPLADWLACQCHDIAGVMVFAAGQREARLDLSVQLCRSLIRAAMAADSLNCDEFPI